MTPKSITCIGIGNMGAALAGALLTGSAAPTAQSPNLTLWNRTPDRPQVRALVEQGAVLETNLATAVANSEVVVICLLDYPSVMAVFSALEGGQGGSPLANKVIVNLTNGTASQARASSTYFKQVLGAAAYFDGAIMVVPQQVGTAESFMVLSGESQAGYDTLVRDVLTPIGATLYLGSNPDGPTPRNDEGESDPGAAALHDLAALSAMYGMFIGAFTGFALLQNGLKNGQTKVSSAAGQSKEGKVPNVQHATDAVTVPVLKSLAPHVSLLAEQLDREDWLNDMGNSLAMQLEGVKNIVRACEEEGVDGSGLTVLVGWMDAAVKEGFGAGSVVSVVRHMFTK